MDYIKPTLGGATFVFNGVKYDYNFLATIACLLDLCDEVSIVCGGTDGTVAKVMLLLEKWPYVEGKHVIVTTITEAQWNAEQGPARLSVFMNIALDRLTTSWILAVQADEIIYDRSFPVIRRAIEDDTAEAYVMARYNAWRDPLSMLNVEQSRKPCSTEVIRLARNGYFCYSDGEHLAVERVSSWNNNVQAIEMYHAGYIRDAVKHVAKARHMFEDIFGYGMDKRIGDKFDHTKFPFTDKDIVPVPLPLPTYIVPWLRERYPDIKL